MGKGLTWMEGKRIQEAQFNAKLCVSPGIGWWVVVVWEKSPYYVCINTFLSEFSYATKCTALIILVRLDKAVGLSSRCSPSLLDPESTCLLRSADAHL